MEVSLEELSKEQLFLIIIEIERELNKRKAQYKEARGLK